MKKTALIAALALATSLTVFAAGGGKKGGKAKKQKAKTECCERSKCTPGETPVCGDKKTSCNFQKS